MSYIYLERRLLYVLGEFTFYLFLTVFCNFLSLSSSPYVYRWLLLFSLSFLISLSLSPSLSLSLYLSLPLPPPPPPLPPSLSLSLWVSLSIFFYQVSSVFVCCSYSERHLLYNLDRFTLYLSHFDFRNSL